EHLGHADSFRRYYDDNKFDYFRAQLQTSLSDVPETRWPKAVIVTGDLVERGGAIPGEMETAATFLKDLAKYLKITPQRIMVVPGNHDMDWSQSSFEKRSAKFREAMQDFTIPRLLADGPMPHLEPLYNVAPGIDIEILLLVSPTYSGI